MVRFGVIADDFTGACDVGIQFKKRGLETMVLVDVDSLKEVRNCDVVVVDTESRNEKSEVAYNRVRAAVRCLKDLGVKLVYKKIDSTLRGNIGAELDAVMDELGLEAMILAPAFPATKRTTISGRQLVNGTPLEETEFARDPLHPVKESYIPTLVMLQTQRRIGVIKLPHVREGAELLKREIRSQTQAGCEIIVVDAETSDDLMVIAEAALNYNDVLLCGSAGLAEGASYWLTSSPQGRRLLAVSGSVNNVTLNQISFIERALNVEVLEPDLLMILKSNENCEAEIKRLVKAAGDAFTCGKDVVIRLARSKEDILRIQRVGRHLGMDDLKTARRILSFLGKVSRRIMSDYKITGLILVGGDTSIEVIKNLGAQGVKIEEEILPGIPLSRMVGGSFDGLPTVTKAGGFGQENALMVVIKKLKGLFS